MEEQGGGERGGPGKNTTFLSLCFSPPSFSSLFPSSNHEEEISYFIQLNFLFHKNQIYDHTFNDGILNAGQNTPRS